MKTIFFTLLTILTLQLSSQSFSTINFVNNFSKNLNFQIYLNEQLAGSLNKDENLECKIYSEGRISIIIITGTERITGTIDVKQGNTYYYKLSFGSFKLVDEEKGKNIYAKNSNTIKMEEDRKNPICKSIRNDEDNGPKQGTCFLLNQQGYFLTNYHVISGAKTVQIKGIGNDFSTLYGVDVIAYDIDLDLALLKLKNQNINFPKIPYSLSLQTNLQGTKSFVLGYPLTTAMGEEIKVTEGLVSAKSGYKGTISQYQFSAAIQPGNSGSPLFNDKGEVIGIINAKLQGAEGAGYAIKSQYVLTFIKLIDSIQIDNNETQLTNLSFTDKIATLKNFIFIVKSE
jgi:S1-C subfamily serine protease